MLFTEYAWKIDENSAFQFLDFRVNLTVRFEMSINNNKLGTGKLKINYKTF